MATEIDTLNRNLQYVVLALEQETVIGGWKNDGVYYGMVGYLLKTVTWNNLEEGKCT